MLLVAYQIPLRSPSVADIVVRRVLPAVAGNQLPVVGSCCRSCCRLLLQADKNISYPWLGLDLNEILCMATPRSLPPSVRVTCRCSAGSNLCRRAHDNCLESRSDYAKHRRVIAVDVMGADTRTPCWPPGTQMTICERCLAPGTATAAPSWLTAICHSDPSNRRSHRSHPHRQLARRRALPPPSVTVWAWLWGTVCRLCRAWRTKELQGCKKCYQPHLSGAFANNT